MEIIYEHPWWTLAFVAWIGLWIGVIVTIIKGD